MALRRTYVVFIYFPKLCSWLYLFLSIGPTTCVYVCECARGGRCLTTATLYTLRTQLGTGRTRKDEKSEMRGEGGQSAEYVDRRTGSIS